MRLIDADAAKSRIIEETTKTFSEMNIQTFVIAAGMANMFDCEDDFPTIDAKPVRHGKWKHVPGMNSKCSECGRYFPVKEFESRPFDINYCPNCGAKMDGGDDKT